jgi:hypothetical protein
MCYHSQLPDHNTLHTTDNTIITNIYIIPNRQSGILGTFLDAQNSPAYHSITQLDNAVLTHIPTPGIWTNHATLAYNCFALELVSSHQEMGKIQPMENTPDE